MSECPCGLTQEQLLAAPSLSLGPGMVCIALDANNNPCGRRLVDHPHQQPVDAFDPKKVYQSIQSLQSPPPAPASVLYTQIGLSLLGDPIVGKLMDDIVKTRNDAKSSHHFYLVDGHSGIGKTQLPFVFRAAGVPLHHLLMTVNSTDAQEIYKPLESSSLIFTNALARDVRQYFGDTDLLSMPQLLTNLFELQTVCVIFALLGVEFDHNNPWTVPHLAGYIRNYEHKDQLPIFFLDEVLPPFDHRQGGVRPASSVLRLARNLLRAVGLVPVLMGTNSSAANFISAATNSRGGNKIIWCKLVTLLPPPNAGSLEAIGAERVINTLRDIPNLSSICPFLNQQFRSCTPWFIELFVRVVDQLQDSLTQAMSATGFLDRVLCGMANEVFRGKGSYHIQSFLRAQFCFHLKPFRKPHQGEGFDSLPVERLASCQDRTVFVASHFASLDDEDCDLFVTGKFLSKDNSTEWVPTASFRGAETESFLYLMLGDGNQEFDFPAPFASSLGRMTTSQTFWSLIESHNRTSRGTVIQTENEVAMKRNGNDLEAYAAVAVEIASHRGGLGGIELFAFLLQLATELLPSYQLLEWSDQSPFPVSSLTAGPAENPTNPFAGKRVPYLCAEGDSWPQAFREIEGVYWGHLCRTPDCERTDLKILTTQSPTHPEISGECKNYSNNLNGDVLREILERIPETSWLHLVICTHLQANYWTKQTKVNWEDFRASHGLGESAILRVVKQESRIALQPLFPGSVPQTPATKLVIFFPFEDWMLKETEKKRKRGTIES